MEDFVYVGITIAFFAICVGYVRGLDRLVRQSEESEQSDVGLDQSEVTQ